MELEQKPAMRQAVEKIGDKPIFVRNAWYAAIWSADLVPGSTASRKVLGDSIVFYRDNDGAVHALQDRCPHRFAPLSRGAVLENGSLRCGYHGLEFDGAGTCVRNPHGNHNILPALRVRSYIALEKHSMVWVWPGDCEPDYSTVPDLAVIDSAPTFAVAKRDWVRVNAGYRLIIDNLMDASHTSYLHDGILGNLEMVDAEITVVQEGDKVVVGRASQNTTIPGLFEMFWPYADKRVDKWNAIAWMPPAVVQLYSGVCKPGAAHESGTGYYGIHLLTPESEHSTIYHFTAVRWNVLTEGDEKNSEIREKLSEGRRFAFWDQDAQMIHAQQIVMNDAVKAGDKLTPVLLAIDAAPVRYGRILQRMIDEETQSSG